MRYRLRSRSNCFFCKEIVKSNSSSWKEEYFHSNCLRCAQSKNGNETNLCSFCRHMRISHLILCEDDGRDSIHIPISVDRVFRKRSNCDFCRLFAQAFTTCKAIISSDVKSMTLYIMRCTYSIHISDAFEAIHTIPIHILSRGSKHGEYYLGRTFGHRPDKVSTLGEYVDWNKAHSLTRLSDTKTASETLPLRRPHKLKLVDVEKNRVIEAPAECKYLALSYVFGGFKKVELPLFPFFSRDSLPLTIQDALATCVEMNVPYLWTDQLCINQNDTNEMQEQISQMDLIYKCAATTLVGLGKDANCGLPGVSKPRPWKLIIVDGGVVSLTLFAPSAPECILNSTWLTRGWTFQEAVLSTRLLFFTDYGVYHYCQNRPKTFDSEAVSNTSGNNIPLALADYWSALEQYTSRQLTYSSDIVHAFSAVLSANYGEDTYYGLPLQHFDRAVTWSHKDSGLSKRRKEFPSWSWTSHRGPIKHQTNIFTGLALWWVPAHGSDTTFTICKPTCGEPWREMPVDLSQMKMIVVAWLQGCIAGKFPVEPVLSPSTAVALFSRWPTYDAFWHEAFGGYSFTLPDLKLGPGRILVHGQTAQFSMEHIDDLIIDRPSDIHEHHIILSPDGSWAGMIRIPRCRKKVATESIREFIALSIGPDGDLFSHEIWAPPRRNELGSGPIDDLLYQDMDLRSYITVNVMLVKRKPNSNVASRVGVGQIFLRKWEKADRKHKTLILK